MEQPKAGERGDPNPCDSLAKPNSMPIPFYLCYAPQDIFLRHAAIILSWHVVTLYLVD